MSAKSLLHKVESWIGEYLYTPEADAKLVMALWSVATFFHLSFDAFPYLSITASTKRAGKTRALEILELLCHAALQAGNTTAPNVYRMLDAGSAVTLLIDEAERLGGEAQTDMGEVINSGYRKGGKVIRGQEPYTTYGPKAFTSIGDLRDTARDRAIVITLARLPVGMRLRPWLFGLASSEAEPLRKEVEVYAEEHRQEITDQYAEVVSSRMLAFLTSDRDQEIWAPLFALCLALDASQLPRLTRIAVDLAGLKTAPKRVASLEEERQAEDAEYAERLLRDLRDAMGARGHLFTGDALKALHGLPTAPWRVFRGVGLDDIEMARLLRVHGVAPALIRQGSSRKAGSVVRRGYRRADVDKATADLGH